MKKRIISLLLAMTMTALYVPSIFAQEHVNAAEGKGGVVEQTDNEENTLRMIGTYPFDVSKIEGGTGGYDDYTQITTEAFSLNKDDIITVSGTWYPANAYIWIELTKGYLDDGTAVYIKSGESVEMHIPSEGVYYLRIMSPRYDVNGMVQIQW